MITPEHVAAQADHTAAQGTTLRSLGVAHRSRSLAAAAALLADPDSPQGQSARADLPGSTGLSPEMVDWALRTTLDPITPESLLNLWHSWNQLPGLQGGGEPGGSPEEEARGGRFPLDREDAPADRSPDPARRPHERAPEGPASERLRSGDPARLARGADAAYHLVPPRLTTLILAGNVFTAAVRPILFALLAGSPVICKASSRDDVFPRLLAEALEDIDSTLAAAFSALTFPGGTTHLEDPLLARSDAVLVYGSDATLQALRSRVPPSARLLEHGHGVGASYVPAHVLADPDRAAEAAHGLALDVAAYDQRGCLSPQAVWVEGGKGEAGRRFAELIQTSLDRWNRNLPKGPLPTAVAAAQSQWRGVLAAIGDLLECPGGAVAVAENPALPVQGGPPWGPGWRNLLVLPCEGPADVASRLAPLGMHLKALGVGGTSDDLHRLAEALPPPLVPRLGPLGRMQTPPLEALDDGAPPFEGLLRWRQTVR